MMKRLASGANLGGSVPVPFLLLGFSAVTKKSKAKSSRKQFLCYIFVSLCLVLCVAGLLSFWMFPFVTVRCDSACHRTLVVLIHSKTSPTKRRQPSWFEEHLKFWFGNDLSILLVVSFKFHTGYTVQSQQRAERDAAITRLEQSRIILAMRLADHHGKKYTVIEEAQAFVGDVHETGRFVSPENLFESPRNLCDENLKGEKYRFGTVMQVLLSSCNFAKRTLKLEQMGGVLGNAALVAVSMLALLHLHQAAISNNSKRNSKNKSQEGSSSSGFVRSLDVLEARG